MPSVRKALFPWSMPVTPSWLVGWIARGMGYGYGTKIIFSGLSVLSFGSFFRGEGEAGASYDASGKRQDEFPETGKVAFLAGLSGFRR